MMCPVCQGAAIDKEIIGAHLLLFFLAFVFGSFCTFCFHMLMYLFDEKCVLFPKLLSLTSLKHNIIYEFIPPTKDIGVMPVDFVSTQWVEKSACSLPTFVPLVSGIFGLVWTTMFLMCSSGNRTLTSLQKPWRVLPPVFVFSLAMGCLCIYTSVVTHYGLQDLCLKLGEMTGSTTCSYTVNVATLTYERRIRGVYQATRLTILSAWLHTICWLLSALLALVRVLLAVDFQLVRVTAQLHGDIDKIQERHEVQLRSISPKTYVSEENERAGVSTYQATMEDAAEENDLRRSSHSLIYLSKQESHRSMLSLIPEEMNRQQKAETDKLVDEDKAFIVAWLYDLVENIPDLFETGQNSVVSVLSEGGTSTEMISRQHKKPMESQVDSRESVADTEQIIFHEPDFVEPRTDQARKPRDKIQFRDESPQPSTSKRPLIEEALMNTTSETEHLLEDAEDEKVSKRRRKSSLKTIGIQTDKAKRGQRVQISEYNVARIRSDLAETETQDQTTTAPDKIDVEKETQTREKEKQD